MKTLGQIAYEASEEGGQQNFGDWNEAPDVVKRVHEAMAREVEKEVMRRLETETEEKVIQRIRERREAGRRKYKTSMERDDLSMPEWLRHAQEEAIDLAIYLERAIFEANAQGHRPDDNTQPY